MRLTESPVKTRSVAFLLGIASVAAFAPFGGFPLIWLTLGGLFALLETVADRRASTRDGALIGWFFGFGFFITFTKNRYFGGFAQTMRQSNCTAHHLVGVLGINSQANSHVHSFIKLCK